MKVMAHFRPRRAKHFTRREQAQFLLLGLATVYEGLVMVLSLGFLTVETRAWLLFDVFDSD